jgi:hypothetical protein
MSSKQKGKKARPNSRRRGGGDTTQLRLSQEPYEVYAEVKKFCGNMVQVHIDTKGYNTIMTCVIRKKTNKAEVRRRGSMLKDFYALVQPMNDKDWTRGEVICFYSDTEKRQLVACGEIKEHVEDHGDAFVFADDADVTFTSDAPAAGASKAVPDLNFSIDDI